MKVQSEKTGQGEVTLTIEVESDRVQNALRQAARELSRRARIPGFRPGKAPYAIVERYLGKDALYEKAVENLGPQLYEEALKEANIEPYDQGKLDVAELEPLTLKAIVPVEPVVTLGDYKAIKAEKAKIEFDESQIEKTLTQLREQHAEWTPIERPIQEGDQVTVDLTARSGEETILSQPSRRTEVRPEMFPASLYEKLIGAQAGQTLDYEVTFPEDDANTQFAGKTVQFHVEILQASERKLPELSDEFAKTVGDYDSLEKLQQRIRETHTKRQEDEAREKLENEILEQIIAQSTLEYPPVAVEREIDRRIQDLRRNLEGQGFTWTAYLNMLNKQEAELRDEARPEAEKAVRQMLVLAEAAKAEDIQVSEEEVQAEINRMAQAYGGENAAMILQVFSRPDSREGISSRVRLTKSMNRLISLATGEPEEQQPAAQAESATPEAVATEGAEPAAASTTENEPSS